MVDLVRSVSQAFAILRLLGDSAPASLSEISRQLAISPSTCHNILATLVESDVIERDRSSKRYKLAAGWENKGAASFNITVAVVERSQSAIDRIAAQHHAAIGVWKIASRERVQLIAQAEPRGGVRLRLESGQRQPLGSGAVGRALAAAQNASSRELRRRFAPVRWQSDVSFDAYEWDVAEAARRGYAMDCGLTYRGINSVAVAVEALAPGFCLSASFSSGSLTASETEQLARCLMELAENLSEIGGRD